jgi:hypothetical protein
MQSDFAVKRNAAIRSGNLRRFPTAAFSYG